MENVAKKQFRLFGGKTENFKNKEEKVFNQRMLKAYLKGHKHFYYGIDSVNGGRKEHDVLILKPE